MDKPKGYLTPEGYFGLINGKWQMFVTEEEYLQNFEEDEDERKSN